MNARFTVEFGYSAEDLPTVERWLELSYPEPAYRERVRASWIEAAEEADSGRSDIETEEFSIRRKDGSFGTYIMGTSLVDGSLLASFVDITERKRAVSALQEAAEKQARHELLLREQNERILDLVVSGPILLGDFEAALRGIAELAVRLIRVGRASIWFYSDDDATLRCAELYQLPSGGHSSGSELRATDFPAYAAAHRRGEIVAVRDLRSDPRARGFPAEYRDACGFSSLLDAPVRLGPRVKGILRLEAVGEERDWSPEDERLATMLATTVSLAYQAAEHKRARIEATKGEEALRAIIDASPYSIAIVRMSDGVYLDGNRALLNSLGLADRSELAGRDMAEFQRLLDEDSYARFVAAFREGRNLDGFQYEILRQGGERNFIMLSTRCIERQGEPAYVAIVVDITQLKLAEEELKKLNAELERKVAERTEDLAQANLELQAVNIGLSKAMDELEAAQGAILVSEKLAALGRLVAGIAHELNTPLAAIAASSRIELRNLGAGLDEAVLAASRLGPEELRIVREARLKATASAGPVAVESAEERRTRREVEATLRAAGVSEAEAFAEDFVELGIADMARRAAPLLAGPRGGDLMTLLNGVVGTYGAARVAEDAVGKAVRVVSALRTYAHGGEDEAPAIFKLAPGIRGLLVLYYNKTKRGIEILLDIDEGIEVFGRRDAINRIWFNLLNNAIQAVGDTGRLEISARREGRAILVSIADSGPGISEEHKGRIFEPFFTTKSPGEGTGLGLDIARRLARENGGDISFNSRPGRTVFTVSLPLRAD
jgi:PAS domain S-box-containing protein